MNIMKQIFERFKTYFELFQIRTPLPFSRGQTPPSGSPLSHISRGEKMISLSKTKSFESSLPAISSISDLMSPKPDVTPSNDYVVSILKGYLKELNEGFFKSGYDSEAR